MDGGQKPGLAWKTKEKQFLLLTIPGHTLAVDIVRLLQSTDDPAVAQCLSMRRLMSAKAQADVDSSDIFGGQQVGDITVQELKEMLTLARAAQQEMICNTFEAFQRHELPPELREQTAAQEAAEATQEMEDAAIMIQSLC